MTFINTKNFQVPAHVPVPVPVSTIVTLSTGERFIEPEIQSLCPELYAIGFNQSNKYHFDSLYDVLFRAANHRSKSPYFKKISPFRNNMKEDIDYHINEMLDHKEKKSKIIDLCNKFEALCQQFLTDVHPLSLELMNHSVNDHQEIKETFNNSRDKVLMKNKMRKNNVKKNIINALDLIVSMYDFFINNAVSSYHVIVYIGSWTKILHIYWSIR